MDSMINLIKKKQNMNQIIVVVIILDKNNHQKYLLEVKEDISKWNSKWKPK